MGSSRALWAEGACEGSAGGRRAPTLLCVGSCPPWLWAVQGAVRKVCPRPESLGERWVPGATPWPVHSALLVTLDSKPCFSDSPPLLPRLPLNQTGKGFFLRPPHAGPPGSGPALLICVSLSLISFWLLTVSQMSPVPPSPPLRSSPAILTTLCPCPWLRKYTRLWFPSSHPFSPTWKCAPLFPASLLRVSLVRAVAHTCVCNSPWCWQLHCARDRLCLAPVGGPVLCRDTGAAASGPLTPRPRRLLFPPKPASSSLVFSVSVPGSHSPPRSLQPHAASHQVLSCETSAASQPAICTLTPWSFPGPGVFRF